MSKWTDEQKRAINSRECSLLVSAAAGAGKTAVLVERIIRRVLDTLSPVDIDRLLVVTYTNAAAREMKERVGTALRERRKNNPGDYRLQKQLLLLERAHISTLHSFCVEMLRKNYYRLKLPEKAALDPAFRVAEETEALLLKLEVLEDVFEKRYTDEDAVFLELVEAYGGERDDKALQDLVMRLYDFSRSHPSPEDWLANVAESFHAGSEDDVIEGLLEQAVEGLLAPLGTALSYLREAALCASAPGGPHPYLSGLLEEAGMLERVLDCCGYEGKAIRWREAFEALAAVEFKRLTAVKDEGIDEALRDEAKNLRDKAKKMAKEAQDTILARSFEEYVQDLNKIAPLMETLCGLVVEFAHYYLLAKLEKNIIDFSDIEHLTLNLLCDEDKKPSALALKLRESFAEVLIDEYQDINNVQETILRLISVSDGGYANTFMVGDVKQSIYGFRLAEPGLFMEKYRNYSDREDAAEQKIVLAKNFRSKKGIIDGVNFVFRQLMQESRFGVKYDKDAELVYGLIDGEEDEKDEKAGFNGEIEVHLVEKGQAYEDEDLKEQEALDATQLEARIIARRIRELKEKTVWDKEQGAYRPVEYRDIAVLLRTAKTAAVVFVEELQRQGIPAYTEAGEGYLRAQEIQVMISLLRIIDNPRQDIPLAAVLRSPVIGLNSSELAAIRLWRRQGDYYDAVRLAARKERGQLQKKLRAFLRNLRSWRTFARRNSLQELIWLLYRETNYYNYAGAMPDGQQRQANLRMLYDRAVQYERTAMKGLFKFLRFLEKLEERGGDFETAHTLGEKENVVRIMSIHKSKGLEFPVVFVAGIAKKFNFKDLYNDVLLDKDLGIGPLLVDSAKRIKYPTLAAIAIKNRLKARMLAEEMRILYVAMTRARETLILVGAVGEKVKAPLMEGDSLKQVNERLSPGIVEGAASFWDWLIACNPSMWSFFCYEGGELFVEEKETAAEYHEELIRLKRLEPVAIDDSDDGMVENRLNWDYPDSWLAGVPAKLSVTELKNRYYQSTRDNTEAVLYDSHSWMEERPGFLQERRGLSAAEKGSALHLIMRHIDIAGELTKEEIEEEVAGMVAKELITLEEAESINAEEIETFFDSKLGKRLLASPEVMRELPFVMEVAVGELPGEWQGKDTDETVIVQGTVDCLFAEGEGYVLLDYKTDTVSGKEKADYESFLKARYQLQMELYKRAVEMILKKPVTEKVIYSFSLADVIML